MPGSKEYKAAWSKARIASMSDEAREERRCRNRIWMRGYLYRNRRKLAEHRRNRYAARKAAGCLPPVNKECAARYVRERSRRDPLFRLTRNLRTRVSKAIKRGTKSASTFGLLGCSAAYLKSHLEGLFKPGMAWDNYGKWEIDHIKPCASFNLYLESEQRACFHYSNLQPLWLEENRRKSRSRYPESPAQ